MKLGSLGSCIALGGRARNASGPGCRLRLLYSHRGALDLVVSFIGDVVFAVTIPVPMHHSGWRWALYLFAPCGVTLMACSKEGLGAIFKVLCTEYRWM